MHRVLCRCGNIASQCTLPSPKGINNYTTISLFLLTPLRTPCSWPDYTNATPHHLWAANWLPSVQRCMGQPLNGKYDAIPGIQLWPSCTDAQTYAGTTATQLTLLGKSHTLICASKRVPGAQAEGAGVVLPGPQLKNVEHVPSNGLGCTPSAPTASQKQLSSVQPLMLGPCGAACTAAADIARVQVQSVQQQPSQTSITPFSSSSSASATATVVPTAAASAEMPAELNQVLSLPCLAAIQGAVSDQNGFSLLCEGKFHCIVSSHQQRGNTLLVETQKTSS